MPESQASENSSECPDELYNLTKLAEVAVATGQILEQRRLSSSSANSDQPAFTYTHKLFDKSSRTPRPHLIKAGVCTLLRSLLHKYLTVLAIFLFVLLGLFDLFYFPPKLMTRRSLRSAYLHKSKFFTCLFCCRPRSTATR
jgi:hypothetical protein